MCLNGHKLSNVVKLLQCEHVSQTTQNASHSNMDGCSGCGSNLLYTATCSQCYECVCEYCRSTCAECGECLHCLHRGCAHGCVCVGLTTSTRRDAPPRQGGLDVVQLRRAQPPAPTTTDRQAHNSPPRQGRLQAIQLHGISGHGRRWSGHGVHVHHPAGGWRGHPRFWPGKRQGAL